MATKAKSVKAKAKAKPAPRVKTIKAKTGAKPVVKAKPKAKAKTKAAAKVSPLAPKAYAKLPPLAGVEIGTAATGIKYKGRDDVLVIRLPEGTAAAGVFTTSKTASAPVDFCRANVAGGKGRIVVVNSGNSNAFTGKAGVATVKATAEAAARAVGASKSEVYIASTGVIGQRLDPSPVIDGIGTALFSAAADQWDQAARAIMTTDTYRKLATRKAKIDGATVTINGIAKGSGMIAPDLATMLAFVVTDAAIPADVLQALLVSGTQSSFNAITVDSDTSTSDTLLLFATGTAMQGAKPVKRAGDARLNDFKAKLDELLLDLAHQVVKDGEGASKFVRVQVSGAQSAQAAHRIGLAIANSPLVKTAIAGEDANWGRVVMAVGKSGEAANRDKLAIRIGGVDVARNGEAVPGYDETPVARHMKGENIDIEVDVGVGRGSATVWTCDLTYEYIRINADYRS
ncbi:MAG: bifunctional glutamate N-acetyltransferase/amino-acid acetyltransferase ArgJ [Parvibaculum sp.]|uniref:bifunctional glutamate N-acetyltransferase/amino-acid acetyltransferase ArgJ n=1 Tax=Parvibaculum sp. TaxID=2024848 RepID=UPI003C708590